MVGRSCISAGVLTLLFVVYQLWGTGLREAQAQNRLEDEFEEIIGEGAGDPISTDDEPTATTSTTFGPPPPPPEEGDAVARILIPDIGVDKIVVEGVTLDDLKRGPGHYPDTPMPGQAGNAAIAGHRTTYGAPFNRVDELENGDEILVTTAQGSFRYAVSGQQIVSPSQVEVLNNHGDNRLTLTACHPKYSASQRIIVTATLVGPAAPSTAPAPGESNPTSLPGSEGESDDGEEAASGQTIDGAGLSGEGASAWPAVLLAIACAFVWVAAWVLGLLWQRWPAYAVCLPLFLVMLFYFFESFSRLLPANY
jgi:sortase A